MQRQLTEYDEHASDVAERTSGRTRDRQLEFAAKRGIDIIVSSVGLILLAPVLVIIALCSAHFVGRPVLFKQSRPGKDGKPFTLIKFRSMRDATDAHGNLLSDEARLTRFGSFLRRTSLDESPQLWNVLKGEISLVGPRPLLMEYMKLYTPTQLRRHAVRPGITGWAQVNGRNAIDWDQKFTLDLWYVDHWSLWLDIRILAITFWKVVLGIGVSGTGVQTMTKFSGIHRPETSSAPTSHHDAPDTTRAAAN